MDMQRILRLARKTGDKCIIIENDEPAYVIVTFDEYERFMDRMSSNLSQTSMPNLPIKKINTPPMSSTASAMQKKTIQTAGGGQQSAGRKVVQKLSEQQESLNEEELLEKINKDIANYRQQMTDTNANLARPNGAKAHYTEPTVSRSA
ncbi:MAG: hypothetical protein A3B74_02595 [Candidatus Kerfeldbacteria bacterium RIFCSPHIGHO2_02_FULL_42_14]|uniref:Antitoxin n=1 Tax=Candidatus Kerfeldbacteria bacterium RIFCSPHIGHO2_02_FULL_42_14 TaxID=1798540 RepID=A0A1G2AUI1_9BACT|nr:MAG: hypothetical protein A3B74_02595 [Candidatus Kerfeldbacteria bacterium RIFCSPHIGHO2_02_FULL_42_14]OGY80429.1 MAG: hypothetical protein A3E60_05215 [Candidatus Kerfeldbacteria bacterium RIFCSPHIGHO2_12_FULL_42_13]OGY83859.1 MAG: hypothetical protein A3I91_04740 [Candidatus Kerfeldbacteria bacterium RIFCSPLOWO2_02_FULL_42_19]OGY86602.1 MAG: hypothetical protein A3G01_05090 [Candidatus Kerfeldbacteria bacterium RIFCSPLOWO2_12_FULL_43_9]